MPPQFIGKRQTPSGTYEVYTVSDAESAKDFLKTKTISEPKYYLKVETPEGIWGLDKEGLYLQQLLPWQLDVSLAECQGGINPLSVNRFGVGTAARGMADNFVAQVQCGKCRHEWLDGVRYQDLTVVRCPKCKSFNKIDSSSVRVMFA
jgi:hypothetical protein